MKKSIAFIGAMFMSVFAFAQVSKNENTNIIPSRKVMDADVKDLPKDSEENLTTGDIKPVRNQKTTIERTTTTEKTNIIKTAPDYKGQQSSTIQKLSGTSATTTQKKHVSNIKWADTKVAKDSVPASKAASSDMYLKIGDIKGEK